MECSICSSELTRVGVDRDWRVYKCEHCNTTVERPSGSPDDEFTLESLSHLADR